MTDFDSLNQIESGAHLYQFYKTIDDYVSSLAVFFRTGLSKGDACLWLIDESMGIKRVQQMIEKIIPNFLLYLCTGQMTMLSANEWYLKDGNFDEAQSISNAQNYIQKMLDKGYRSIRGAGDAGTIPKKDRPQLEVYEAKMHEIMKELPVIGVCAYPIDDCSMGDVRMIIQHHDHRMLSRP